MQFDTCHEYRLGDPSLYWHDGCCGETLIIADYSTGVNERIMINGVTKDEVLKFAKRIIEESCKIDEETTDVTNKNVVT